ncbi:MULTISPECIES: GtrA family protein [unclassified Leifsonia]|uniref:GtrA family protein n=1 Tax=unclassified Leifsonia TaxID=2663824 RepID=UPI000701814D|nr:MULTISPECIES: GtrA family protein [unclassified Leifsonia]KQX07718.1 hypothetical protein ASC59_08280 [Leifsonia sp. Root1293]KRA12000.1 hypothetical protein ASD61_08280 [Leifsonia sp. Root60]
MRRDRLVRELLQFAFVGGTGLLLDVGLFNLLTLSVLSAHAVHGGPVFAKIISTSVAIAANWVGNRWLTFRDRRRADVVREAVEFGLVSVAGSVIAIACLGLSHYGMHLTSPIADNVSANGVGLILGSAFRFIAYRHWVYGARRPAAGAGGVTVSV